MSSDGHVQSPGDGHADSAGTPWAGRHFEPTPFAGDDGSVAPALHENLIGFRRGEVDASAVLESLRGTRLLVPMLAMLGEAIEGPHGKLVDKSADLAIVTVAARDGRRVLPAFTSVTAMTTWNPKARPVPVEAERVALAAASEGTELVILDPMAETEHGLRRAALEALATGASYSDAWRDPAVLRVIDASVAGETDVLAIRALPGDPGALLDGPELIVALTLRPGLTAESLRALVGRVSTRWAEDGAIAHRVDGIAVKLVSAD